MKAENYFTANDDLVFHFDRLVPWSQLVTGHTEKPIGSRDQAAVQEAIDLYREALTLGGQFAGHDIASRARSVDREGSHRTSGPIEVSPSLRRNLEGLISLGLTSINMPAVYGGEDFPFTASAMLLEVISRADPSTMVQFAFYMSPALMILRFGSDELKNSYVPRLARGEISGAVAMTEPQAGSDVGAITTWATRHPETETWHLNGRKQFITNGCGDFAIVLARSSPESKGLDGLSLFLVDRLQIKDGTPQDNYVVERAEDKIAITGSATCGLAFADSEAVLLGELGNGWREVLTFMNESRVAVGVQAVGSAQAAYAESSSYASERRQMGRPIREHPVVADMLLDMQAIVAGMRALCYAATVAYDMDQRWSSDSNESSYSKRNRAYLRELTPLVKYFGAEEAIHVGRMGLEIHGGYGVIKDYDIERIFRDTLILPIYEGTSEIQALMSIKDVIKAVMRRPASLLDGSFTPTISQASTPGPLGKEFRKARRRYFWSVRYSMYRLLRADGSKDLPSRIRDAMTGSLALDEDATFHVLVNAKRLTNMLAHLHVSRLLIAQTAVDPGRYPIAERMVARTGAVCAEESYRIRSNPASTIREIKRWEDARRDSRPSQ